MKQLLGITLFLLVSFLSTSQECYPDGVTFVAQGEIDFFSQIYPDCKKIGGDVTIGPEISNLDGLLGITHINGSLIIEENQNLIDFTGLDSLSHIEEGLILNGNLEIIDFSGFEKLEFVGVLESQFGLGFPFAYERNVIAPSILVRDNKKLLNFNGFQNLQEVSTIVVSENPSLVNFNGFESLKETGGMLIIWDNPSLENLTGLQDLERIGSGTYTWSTGVYETNSNVSVLINQNKLLTNISGLNNLTSTEGSITVKDNEILEGEIFQNIVDVGLQYSTYDGPGVFGEYYRRFSVFGNPELSLCANTNVCNLITNYNYTIFSNNSPGCTSTEEVFEECVDVGAIYHVAFYDVNKNGVYDENEPLIEGVNATISPGMISTSTYETKGATYYLHPDNYTFDLDTTSYLGWHLTTDSTSYNVQLDSMNNRDSLYFGFHPDNLESDIYAHIYSFPFRCEDIATIDVSAFNGGNTVVNEGILWIEADSNILDIQFVDIPDTIVGENQFGWHFKYLYPGQIFKRNIGFHIPGSNDFELGNPINIKSKIEYTDNIGFDIVSNEFTQIHDCENEHLSKYVEPVYSNGFSFIDEYLYYTIEFHNPESSGYDLRRIEDQIDENLDIGTFEVVTSSHPDNLTTSIDENNKVIFDFDGVHLAVYWVAHEETWEKSIVYVTYRIKPLPNIEEFTIIENFADVYQQNIIASSPKKYTTNTTVNTMILAPNISTIVHPVFLDINEDGIFDSGEPFLNGHKIIIDPGATFSTTNQNTGGIAYLSPGTYTFSYDTSTDSNWVVTTDPSSFTIEVDSIPITDTIYFGVRPVNYISKFNTALFSQALRCNEFTKLDVVADNAGNTIANGTLWIDIDSNTVEVDYIDIPDTIVGTNRYGWHFSELYPQNIIKKQIRVKMPGPQNFPIGDPLYFTSELIYNDLNGSDSATNEYSEVLECAYDPNDKLVSPVYPNNYALIGEELLYTIQFQNTGNAEAYNVVIKDELDENLDIRTFRVVSSSHIDILSTTIDSSNTVTFDFQNIFLPDSTVSFDMSQGYVSYGISVDGDIEENTVIENTADIYFDFNPAITTNTTENIMLTTFDFDGDGSVLWEDCDDSNPEVNNDMIEIEYDGVDNDCDPLTLDDDLDEDGYVYAEDCDDNDPNSNPAAEEIPDNGVDEDCDGSDLITGIVDILGREIQIFPNPVQQQLTISQMGTQYESYIIRLYDVTGKIVYKSVKESNTHAIDMSDLNNAVYFIEILDTKNGGQTIDKILKVR